MTPTDSALLERRLHVKGAFQRAVPTLSWLVPALILLAGGFTLFSSTGRDDAHITYWPAYTLSHFGEMVNYSGDRVEQSSSLLQVVLLAAAHTVSGIDIVTLGRVCSLLFGVLSLLAVYALAVRIHPRTGFPTALLVGTSAYFVYWSFGGLESTLVAFAAPCLILSYASFLRAPDVRLSRLAWPTAATVMFVLVRPEMPIVLVCMMLGALGAIWLKKFRAAPETVAVHTVHLKRLFVLLALGLLVSALLFAFRLEYFGSLFPQPVAAKADGVSLEKIGKGFGYLIDHLFRGRYIILGSLVTVFGVGYMAWEQLSVRFLNPHVLFSLFFLAAYVAFIIFSGGDWMEAGRFIVHLLPVAMVFVPIALRRLVPAKTGFILILAVLTALQIRVLFHVAAKESTGLPAWSRTYDIHGQAATESDPFVFSRFERKNRVHLREIPTIRYLDDVVARVTAYTDEAPLIMSGQMGMVLYHTAKRHYGKIKVIDRAGLADRTLTECILTAKLPKRAKGLVLSYGTYFKQQEALRRECGIASPDIIMDAPKGDQYLKDVSGNGYTVVYVQRGAFYTGLDELPGRVVIADQFIAVRNELLPALEGLEQVRIAFAPSRRSVGTSLWVFGKPEDSQYQEAP